MAADRPASALLLSRPLILQLRRLLADLGVLQGRSPDAAATFVAQQFALADRRSRDGRLDWEEFRRYYDKVRNAQL